MFKCLNSPMFLTILIVIALVLCIVNFISKAQAQTDRSATIKIEATQLYQGLRVQIVNVGGNRFFVTTTRNYDGDVRIVSLD